MRHKPGDRVIALSSSRSKRLQPRKKGTIYIVDDVMYCNGCGGQYVNIGVSSGQGNILCCCGKSQMNNRRMWTYSKEFAPITEDYLKQLEAEENFEMCSIIKKELDSLV